MTRKRNYHVVYVSFSPSETGSHNCEFSWKIRSAFSFNLLNFIMANFVAMLNELAQKRGSIPHYEDVGYFGPDHLRT